MSRTGFIICLAPVTYGYGPWLVGVLGAGGGGDACGPFPVVSVWFLLSSAVFHLYFKIRSIHGGISFD